MTDRKAGRKRERDRKRERSSLMREAGDPCNSTVILSASTGLIPFRH